MNTVRAFLFGILIGMIPNIALAGCLALTIPSARTTDTILTVVYATVALMLATALTRIGWRNTP